jgi:hypothetical protein
MVKIIKPADDDVIEIPAGGVEAGELLAHDQMVDPNIPVLNEEDAEDENALPPRAIRNADGSITLPLLVPVMLKWRVGDAGVVREEHYDELVMHRLNGAMLRAIQNSSKDSVIVVGIAQMTRMSVARVNLLWDRMDGADCMAAGKVLNHFLENGPTIGR